MSNNNNPTKFVLKFDLSYPARPSVVCDSTGFFSELIGDYKFSNVAYVKNLLIGHFIAREEAADYDNKQQQQQQQQQTIWVYNVKAKNTNTTTVYRAPEINFIPLPGDLEAMQAALTSAKISATFFDSQIEKHLDSVGIKPTRANIRAYRKSYTSQISKLLLEEILTKRSTAYITRWFDKLNGNSYFSVRLNNGSFSINIPMSYRYGDAENLVIQALKLDLPRKMRGREYLDSLGITVVDLGYKLKREMFKAAFHI